MEGCEAGAQAGQRGVNLQSPSREDGGMGIRIVHVGAEERCRA
jgi:hypothetical protein